MRSKESRVAGTGTLRVGYEALERVESFTEVGQDFGVWVWS